MKNSPEIYGTVTMGERGQVVIPVKARKALKIEPGDNLIAMSGPPGRQEIITLIPSSHVAQFLQHFEQSISVLKKELGRESK